MSSRAAWGVIMFLRRLASRRKFSALKTLWIFLLAVFIISLIIISLALQKILSEGQRLGDFLAQHKKDAKWPGIRIPNNRYAQPLSRGTDINDGTARRNLETAHKLSVWPNTAKINISKEEANAEKSNNNKSKEKVKRKIGKQLDKAPGKIKKKSKLMLKQNVKVKLKNNVKSRRSKSLHLHKTLTVASQPHAGKPSPSSSDKRIPRKKGEAQEVKLKTERDEVPKHKGKSNDETKRALTLLRSNDDKSNRKIHKRRTQHNSIRNPTYKSKYENWNADKNNKYRKIKSRNHTKAKHNRTASAYAKSRKHASRPISCEPGHDCEKSRSPTAAPLRHKKDKLANDSKSFLSVKASDLQNGSHSMRSRTYRSRYDKSSNDYWRNYERWMDYFRKKLRKYDYFREEDFEPLSGREVEGGFSTVRFYREVATNRKVAIKRIIEGADINAFFRSLELALKETRLMAKIHRNHVPFVSELIKVLKNDKNSLYMVMDYISGKDLTDLLNEMRRRGIRRYTSAFTAGVIARVSLALISLHRIKIAYKDLKFENIVAEYARDTNSETGDTTYRLHNARLVDYGLSEILLAKNNYKCNAVNGTPTTLAPEVYKKGWHGTPADIWSLGVVMYMMLSGDESPFDHECSRQHCDRRHDSTEMIRENVLHKEISFPEDVFERDAADLLGAMLKRNPEERITAAQIIEHEWFINNGVSFDALMEEEKRVLEERDRFRNATQPITAANHDHGPDEIVDPDAVERSKFN